MKLMISSIVMCSSVALKCFWSLKVAHARMVHQLRGARLLRSSPPNTASQPPTRNEFTEVSTALAQRTEPSTPSAVLLHTTTHLDTRPCLAGSHGNAGFADVGSVLLAAAAITVVFMPITMMLYWRHR
jgi:hypothetical protein